MQAHICTHHRNDETSRRVLVVWERAFHFSLATLLLVLKEQDEWRRRVNKRDVKEGVLDNPSFT
jgi:hypothetical protein